MPQLNWVDYVSGISVCIAAISGWRAGFFELISGLGAMIGASWASITFSSRISTILSTFIHIPLAWIHVLSYIGVFLLVEILVGRLLIVFVSRFVKRFIPTIIDRSLGVPVALINCALIVLFVLAAILQVPFQSTITTDIRSSYIGKTLAQYMSKWNIGTLPFTRSIQDAIGQVATLTPASNERLLLSMRPQNWDLVEDQQSEHDMLNFLNADRVTLGLLPFVQDPDIANVARLHSRDMFMRRYVAHESPEGYTLENRLDAFHIPYSEAAENIVYGPGILEAYQGLKQSESHRENMFDSVFTKAGIGIIDGGVFGLMVTQIFIR